MTFLILVYGRLNAARVTTIKASIFDIVRAGESIFQYNEPTGLIWTRDGKYRTQQY